jgi:hypothetical protein
MAFGSTESSEVRSPCFVSAPVREGGIKAAQGTFGQLYVTCVTLY